MENTRKFSATDDQGKQVCCPPPLPPPCPMPVPPPSPCPHQHGHLLRGIIAYINAYIDARMRQMYLRLKKYIQKLINEQAGILDYVLLRDVDTQDIHKVFIKGGTLRSELHSSAPADGE